MKYYNLIFAVSHLCRLAITILDDQSCVCYYNLYMNDIEGLSHCIW